MTPSSPDRRPDAAHRIALVAVGALVGVSFTAGLGTTAARLTDSDLNSATTGITTRPACMQTVGAYTSEMLDAAVLRWSFSTPLQDGATQHSDGVDPVPVVGPPGLLECDPAELSTTAGAAGSLALMQGNHGSALTASTPTTLGAPFTLLFWTSLTTGAVGELVSVDSPDAALIVSVAAGTVRADYWTSPAPVTSGSTGALELTAGEHHLVAVSVSVAGDVTLSVDSVQTAPTGLPLAWPTNGTTLTVGARTGQINAGALVDEVTLLDSAYGDAQLKALVDADRWWAPGALP